MSRPRLIWLALRRYLVLAVATALVLLVALQGLLRLALPLASEQRARIESELSALLQHPVTIERIDTHWERFVPYIDVVGLRLEGDAGDQRIERLSVGFDPVDMLRSRHWAPSHLSVSGLNVEADYHPEKGYSLPGFSPRSGGQMPELQWDVITRHKHIVIEDAGVLVRNRSNGKTRAIDDLSLAMSTGGNGYDGYLRWREPEALVSRSIVDFELSGQLMNPASWKGGVHLDIPRLDIDEMKDFVPVARRVERGHLALTADIDLAGERHATGSGQIDLDVTLARGGRFIWQTPLALKQGEKGETRLEVINALRVDGSERQLLSGLYAAVLPDEQRVEAGFERLDVSAAAGFVATARLLPGAWLERLAKAAPEGGVESGRWQWQPGEGWAASGTLFDFASRPAGPLPGFSRTDVAFSGRDGHWQFDINEDDWQVDSGGLFLEPLEFRRFVGTVLLKREDKGWSVSAPAVDVVTPDLSARARLGLAFPAGQAPELNLYATVENADVSAVPRYMPMRALKTEGTKNWIKNAFVEGRVKRGDVHIEGPLDALFEADSIFRISAQVEDATLHYLDAWPDIQNIDARFEMLGPKMVVDASSAEVGELKPQRVYAEIEDFRRSSLALTLEAPHTPLSAIFNYVRKSGLDRFDGPVADIFRPSGHADVYLDFYKRLSRRHYSEEQRKATFSGALRLHDVGLDLKEWQLDFTGLDGEIHFSEQEIRSEKIGGQLNGQDFEANFRTDQGEDPGNPGRARVSLAADLSAANVLGDRLPWLTRHLGGRSRWDLSLDFPMGGEQSPPHLKATTDGKGLTVSLPAPLYKAADHADDLALEVVFGGDGPDLSLTSDSGLRGRFLFAPGEPVRGALHYRRGEARIKPEPGLQVVAATERLDVEPWLKLFDNGVEQSGAAPGVNIDLRSDQVSYRGYRLQGVDALVRPRARFWRLYVNADGVSGRADIPHRAGSPYDIRLQKLDLGRVMDSQPPGVGGDVVDPGTLPSMAVSIDDFVFGQRQLQNLRFKVEAGDRGLRIPEMSVDDEALAVEGSARWWLAGGEPRSSVDFELKTDDAGLAMERLGLAGVVREGRGQVAGELHWDGPLYAVDKRSLAGRVHGALSDGEFLSVTSNTAKLVGLLSIQALPQRLALDFSDVSGKGLRFKTATGRATLDSGIITLESSEVDANFGTIALQGRTDLVQQEVDQVAVVTPDVSNVLPVTAGVVGGVPGLIGAVVVDRLIKIMGGDTDRIAQVRYHIRGPWGNPEVERTRVKRIKDLSEEELRQRAEEIARKLERQQVEESAQ